MKRRFRVYPDTSVFGAVFDHRFATETAAFWSAVEHGCFDVIVSDVTYAELHRAPERVQRVMDRVPADRLATARASAEADDLARAYIERGAVAPTMWNDGLHVALATVSAAEIIASWNFKHLVNVRRIRLYQSVNLELGYPLVDIRTPKEIADDE